MVTRPQAKEDKTMLQGQATAERRTSADDVFDFLHGEISALKLLPGTRISEVEIARQFDVSRQPVREAFIRLANLDLIHIRPQKATLVRGFSYETIQRSRFIRMAIESEILRRACSSVDEAGLAKLRRALDQQTEAIAKSDIERFHALDYDFHRILCHAANCAFAFKTITENKAIVDRLCLLSLNEATAMETLLADHTEIVEGLTARNQDVVVAAITKHLGRLDNVIAGIRESHANYFED